MQQLIVKYFPVITDPLHWMQCIRWAHMLQDHVQIFCFLDNVCQLAEMSRNLHEITHKQCNAGKNREAHITISNCKLKSLLWRIGFLKDETVFRIPQCYVAQSSPRGSPLTHMNCAVIRTLEDSLAKVAF